MIVLFMYTVIGISKMQCHTGVCEKHPSREEDPLEYRLSRAPTQGLESSFWHWIARPILAEKECCIHRHWYNEMPVSVKKTSLLKFTGAFAFAALEADLSTSHSPEVYFCLRHCYHFTLGSK